MKNMKTMKEFLTFVEYSFLSVLNFLASNKLSIKIINKEPLKNVLIENAILFIVDGKLIK